MGPSESSLVERNIGNDFTVKDGWRMYHGVKVPGFPEHPHRGFETVTVVQRGMVDHTIEHVPVDDPAALAAQWEAWNEEERGRRLVELRASGRLAGLHQALTNLEECCTDAADKREQVRERLSRLVATALESADAAAA